MRLALLVAIMGFASTARADRVVALAPLTTLGAEDTSAESKKLASQLEGALGKLADTKVITAQAVSDAIKKAKKPQLRTCDGDAKCLAELGQLVGAQVVIAGEVGGLGASQVVYLTATDVATAKELRSTTLTVGEKDDGGGPSGAAIRLLEPGNYRGNLHFTVDVSNATIYVNGTKTTLSAKSDLPLPVGTHAIRVTHPEYHDFVKFVTVSFGSVTEVPVGMQQYPIVKHDIEGHPINKDQITIVEPPVYRRWYVVGPAAVAIGVITAIIVGLAVHDYPNGTCRIPGSMEKC